MPKSICEIIISPPRDPFMGGEVRQLVDINMEHAIAAATLINASGLRVVGIREIDVLTVEEFVEARKYDKIMAALTGPSPFAKDGEE